MNYSYLNDDLINCANTGKECTPDAEGSTSYDCYPDEITNHSCSISNVINCNGGGWPPIL